MSGQARSLDHEIAFRRFQKGNDYSFKVVPDPHPFASI